MTTPPVHPSAHLGMQTHWRFLSSTSQFSISLRSPSGRTVTFLEIGMSTAYNISLIDQPCTIKRNVTRSLTPPPRPSMLPPSLLHNQDTVFVVLSILLLLSLNLICTGLAHVSSGKRNAFTYEVTILLWLMRVPCVITSMCLNGFAPDFHAWFLTN